jgi:hypothetical protein
LSTIGGGGGSVASDTLLDLDDEPLNALAHLLKVVDVDGIDVGGGRHCGGGPDGLIDEALWANALAKGLHELLGLVVDDAEELPPLVEVL